MSLTCGSSGSPRPGIGDPSCTLLVVSSYSMTTFNVFVVKGVLLPGCPVDPVAKSKLQQCHASNQPSFRASGVHSKLGWANPWTQSVPGCTNFQYPFSKLRRLRSVSIVFRGRKVQVGLEVLLQDVVSVLLSIFLQRQTHHVSL